MFGQKTLTRVLLCFLMTMVSAVLMSTDSIYFRLHSYHGSEMIPNDKHSTYLQTTRFTLGHYRQFNKGLSIAVQGLYVHDYFDESIRLDSLAICQELGSWSAEYRIYDKEFGFHSYIHRQDAFSSYLVHGLLDSYRFNGFTARYSIGSIAARCGVGGNELNRTLGFGEFTNTGTHHSVLVGGLYAARSNLNNQNEVAIYSESQLELGTVHCYSAAMGEYYRATYGEKKATRLQVYLEPQLKLTSWLQLAAGYRYRVLDCSRAWNNGKTHKISALAQLTWHKWQATGIQHVSYANTQDFTQSQIIVSYFLRSFWQVGFNAAHYAPSPGIETWQVGFQTLLNYGTN